MRRDLTGKGVAPSKIMASQIEQDHAAGGRECRVVQLPSGRTATGSVQLSWSGTKSRRKCDAVFRFRTWGGTQNVALGRMKGTSRTECLKEAWEQVHSRGLLKGGGLP